LCDIFEKIHPSGNTSPFRFNDCQFLAFSSLSFIEPNVTSLCFLLVVKFSKCYAPDGFGMGKIVTADISLLELKDVSII
jgi:hypothetical protein